MKPSTGTVVRVVLLIVALANLFLTAIGVIPEDIVGGSQAYQVGSILVTAAVSLLNTWKNNSFTEEAILADEYMHKLKNGTVTRQDE
jgi:SPP1 family holin